MFRWSGYFADGVSCPKFGEIGLQKRGVVDRDDSVAVDVSRLFPQIVKRIYFRHSALNIGYVTDVYVAVAVGVAVNILLWFCVKLDISYVFDFCICVCIGILVAINGKVGIVIKRGI